ncbi:MAG: hypothetical protein H0W89_06855 [Candidatus Levybacteria bacterium]|nr:hypothetical protein [Candidatus Levybacteria bacterium]
MRERQPTPAENSRGHEREARSVMTGAVARIAFGASDMGRGLLKPEVHRVTTEQKTALRTATPEKLKPLVEAANAVSMDSRNAAPQLTNETWNSTVWNSL